MNQLAMHGGTPVRSTPFLSAMDPAGRTLGEAEAAALAEVIASGRLGATGGTQVPAFEREFADYYAVPHAVACTSGTAALHLAVGALDPAPGDEIITTPITDFGTVIPILAHNAVPVFADVDPRTGLLDPAAVAALVTERTKAIIAVHLAGAPAPIAELAEIARKHDLMLIEDCAQAYLTELPDGRLAGTAGHVGCFSLQQYKHITCGDGGMAITSDQELATRMRLFADKGWPRHTGERTHLSLGMNYRMTELQAAVARVQLGKLAGVVASRRENARRLADALTGLPGVHPPTGIDRHAVWLFPVVLDPAIAGGTNAEWAGALEAEGIPVSAGYLSRPVYGYPVLAERNLYGGSGFPLTSPPASRDRHYPDGLCPNAEELIRRTLLVVHWNEAYTESDVDDIAAAFRKVHAALTATVGTPSGV
ncbi:MULTISPECIES: DegT/DnrJ/EryC1/StrS family aminotransferase [Amycolatopsis]|uniref:Glutamine--scyllo-inositol transaminase n=2 Tax=Amycolatopsis TaxID=1813 RepID=A0A076N066_AMYME|nr:DegT/DnrJ/EryC1/StrS family aminotransferase [Amycolatopsis methanolica]AIJ26233.1 glutamine--scyllo-inositol transaminase [Amycolatopsis methanolica 239]